ncbi:MAG: FAD-dependent oxidoreductase [Stappiaceae bacterium]
MKTRIHAIAGAIGFLTILVFWSSTVISELFGSYDSIAMVKGAILIGMFILIPAMAIVGGSGFSLAAGRTDTLVLAKKKRMPIIGANGLLILVPMAFLLEARASAGQFDTVFYGLQGLELLAGAVNLCLMGLNMRDGIRLSGKGNPPSNVKLVGREMIATDTMAFHMTKPGGFDHKAGQWIRLTLPHFAATDSKGASRILSIVSAPHEPQLTVATRISDSAFKRDLKELPDEAELDLAGPNGSFTLHGDPARPAVFIAGGIGITPLLSMVRHATHSSLAHKITLFYANRDPSAAAFLDELEGLQKTNANFRLIATMTDLQDDSAPWDGEVNLIDQEMLARSLPDLRAPKYYCVGPVQMVASTREMLKSAGVASKDMIIEQFSGY